MLKFILTLIPLMGTSIGACIGVINKFKKFEKQEDSLVAVATGILCAITFNLFVESLQNIRWSLLVGLIVGFLFSGLMSFFAHKNKTSVSSKLFWAMLAHNVPEGIVIGISLSNQAVLLSTISLISSISIQNIPDGFVVSQPLVSKKGKKKALWIGVLSGVVEPIAAISIMITADMMPHIQKFEALLIGFSFSIILMIAVELLKECKNKKIIVIATLATIIVNCILG